MPLPIDAHHKLEEFSEASGDYALVGIFINPQTGEMGTYSSHGMEPGLVLGFLQQAVNQMLVAATNGELEYVGTDGHSGTNEAPLQSPFLN